MARDRLRAAREGQQQQQGGYNGAGGGGYGSDPYAAPQQQYAAPAPPVQAQQNYPPPQQQQQPQYGAGGGGYQMQNLNGANGDGVDMTAFFDEVSSIQQQIKQLQSNINSVSDLHTRRLATTDESQQAQSTSQLTQLTSQTSGLTQSIRTQISRLNDKNKAASPKGDPEFNVRKTQLAGLQNSFRKALEEYQLVEKKSRDKYRQRMERQIKIVKPDATQEEIKAAFDNQAAGQQIFSQALVQSRQQGARAAFAEVQSRNQDLRKIEETITELAQMMQDMATLVLEQDSQVQAVEANAVAVNSDMEAGHTQVGKAVKSARAARRKRWICFFIIVAILIVVAVVVAVEVTQHQNK